MSLTKSAMLEIAQDYQIVQSKIMDHNTLSFKTADGALHVQLHETVIFTRLPDDTLILNTGNWKTVTTKDRLNKCLRQVTRELNYPHVSIYTDKGIWYFKDNNNIIPFYDGMRFKLGDYAHLNAQSLSALNDQKILKKKIDLYIKACMEYLKNKIVFPKPSGGGCWYCYMHTDQGKPLGDSDTTHLISHLDELYIFGSLVYNALKDCNAGPIWYNVAFDPNSASFRFTSSDKILCRYIRRYLKRKLGLA
jgi:hypothetical protein